MSSAAEVAVQISVMDPKDTDLMPSVGKEISSPMEGLPE